MRTSLWIILFVVIVALTGCASTGEYLPTETQKQLAWAVNDSTHADRYDLASTYSDQEVRLIAPPKSRIKVVSVSQTVVPQSASLPAVHPSSLSAKQLKSEATVVNKTTKSVDTELQKKDDTQAQTQADNKSLKVQLAAASKWKWIVIAAVSVIAVVAAIAVYIKIP